MADFAVLSLGVPDRTYSESPELGDAAVEFILVGRVLQKGEVLEARPLLLLIGGLFCITLIATIYNALAQE